MIPDWEIAADEAAKLGAIYSDIQSHQYPCSGMVCTFPHDGNCWCFNTALARYTAQAIEARRAETQSGSVADESAVPEGNAPKDSPTISSI